MGRCCTPGFSARGVGPIRTSHPSGSRQTLLISSCCPRSAGPRKTVGSKPPPEGIRTEIVACPLREAGPTLKWFTAWAHQSTQSAIGLRQRPDQTCELYQPRDGLAASARFIETITVFSSLKVADFRVENTIVRWRRIAKLMFVFPAPTVPAEFERKRSPMTAVRDVRYVFRHKPSIGPWHCSRLRTSISP